MSAVSVFRCILPNCLLTYISFSESELAYSLFASGQAALNELEAWLIYQWIPKHNLPCKFYIYTNFFSITSCLICLNCVWICVEVSTILTSAFVLCTFLNPAVYIFSYVSLIYERWTNLTFVRVPRLVSLCFYHVVLFNFNKLLCVFNFVYGYILFYYYIYLLFHGCFEVIIYINLWFCLLGFCSFFCWPLLSCSSIFMIFHQVSVYFTFLYLNISLSIFLFLVCLIWFTKLVDDLAFERCLFFYAAITLCIDVSD